MAMARAEFPLLLFAVCASALARPAALPLR